MLTSLHSVAPGHFTEAAIKPWRLTPNDRKVIALAQPDARASVREIATKGRMRHHSVTFTLKQLKERRILKPYILTNPHAIALTDYCVFFNYIGTEKQARRKIIETCVTSPKVAYFAELTGAYQYSVSLFCRSAFEVSEFFQQLSGLLPRSAFDISFALRLQFTQFLGKYVAPGRSPVVLDRGKARAESSIDEIDRKILGFYSQHAGSSLQKVAGNAGVSESTVRTRLARLEKCGIILGYPYLFDVAKIGLTSFRILLAARGYEPSFHAKAYDYMVSHPYCSAFVHCIGSWDFEFNFDVESPSAIGPIVEEVQDHFSDHIRTIRTVVEIAVHRAHHFPEKAGESTNSCC